MDDPDRIPVDLDDEESYAPVFDEGHYDPWESDE